MVAESPQCNDLNLYRSAINLLIGTNAYFHRTIAMKKISKILTAGIFTMLSVTAFACPQGTTLTGGTGANHKGGTCVSIAKDAKHQDRTATHAAQVAQHDAKVARHDTKQASQLAQSKVKHNQKLAKHDAAQAQHLATQAKSEAKTSAHAAKAANTDAKAKIAAQKVAAEQHKVAVKS